MNKMTLYVYFLPPSWPWPNTCISFYSLVFAGACFCRFQHFCEHGLLYYFWCCINGRRIVWGAHYMILYAMSHSAIKKVQLLPSQLKAGRRLLPLTLSYHAWHIRPSFWLQWACTSSFHIWVHTQWIEHMKVKFWTWHCYRLSYHGIVSTYVKLIACRPLQSRVWNANYEMSIITENCKI